MKFYVKDEDGKNFAVEEVDEIPTEEYTDEDETSTLSVDEVLALKRLAAVADKIIALAETDEPIEGEESGEIVDEDEDEEIVDTDKPVKGLDSKKSFGKIEVKQNTNDSFDSLTDDVSNAWAKRYGGK